ncbi:MAG: HAMP domain-containing protein [Candidatus Marithrix sp.]|nr:HAMP domain-containing protein [Candidatus Marithrix sp.]
MKHLSFLLPIKFYQPSLRQKIIFGYYFIVAIIIVLAAFTYTELQFLESKLTEGGEITEFVDAILELRRFEKNYFLYHQNLDYQKYQIYINKIKILINNNHDKVAKFLTPIQHINLTKNLEYYQKLMQNYVIQASSSLEQEIRHLGNSIVTLAEALAKTERKFLKESLNHSINLFLLAILSLSLFGIVMGRILSQLVVHPLKQLEKNMELIATGRFKKLNIKCQDREIRSLEQAFNQMLIKLETQRRHLLQSEKLASLGTLLSGVAHELNNPLSNISSSCQILLEELEETDINQSRELLTQIDEQTLRSQRIVCALLEFSRKKDFKKEPLQLSDLIQETLRFIRGQVPASITINQEIPKDLIILVDKQRIQQMLLNLLKNSIQAVGHSGDINLYARKTCITGDDCMMNLEISDTGPGIPAELLPKIFDPFFTTKEVGQGSGLGLSIAHEIIEEHDGKIQVNSHPDGGTIFRIQLPTGT